VLLTIAETIFPETLASLPTTIVIRDFPEIILIYSAYADVNLIISIGVSPSPMIPRMPEMDLIKVMTEISAKIGKFAA